jgi:hypothetical protein
VPTHDITCSALELHLAGDSGVHTAEITTCSSTIRGTGLARGLGPKEQFFLKRVIPGDHVVFDEVPVSWAGS